MGKISASVLRGKELAEKLKQYSSKAKTGLEKAVLKGALVVEGDAKRLTPVDTGYLRASMTHQLYTNAGDPFALVGTNTEYAPFVENGTSKQSSHPFLRPAFENNSEEIQKEIKAAFKWS